MDLGNLFDKTCRYNQIEDIILTNLEAAKDIQAVYDMSGDFILNVMNLSGKNPEESAVMMAALFELPTDSFSVVVTFSYYLAALEFWSYVNAEDSQLQDVIINVNSEVARCKDVTGAFLTGMLPLDAYINQLQIFRTNFTISDRFQDTLGNYLSSFQKEMIQKILEKFAQ